MEAQVVLQAQQQVLQILVVVVAVVDHLVLEVVQVS